MTHGLIFFEFRETCYCNDRSSGHFEVVTVTRDITTQIEGKRILVVDDILDSGRTMSFTVTHLRKKGPATLKTCVFLDKPERREVDFHADYVGFHVPDKFLVGYGLDYDNRYRELPYISLVIFKKNPSD